MRLPDLFTAGRLVGMLHATPETIRAAARELGIEPRLRINGAEYFTLGDVGRIRKHLAGERHHATT